MPKKMRRGRPKKSATKEKSHKGHRRGGGHRGRRSARVPSLQAEFSRLQRAIAAASSPVEREGLSKRLVALRKKIRADAKAEIAETKRIG